jgi:polyisoprenoid-binding protein YceI
MKKIIFAALFAAFWSVSAGAHWTLDNDMSQLSFVTIKAGSAAEVHHFNEIEGRVDDKGNVTLSIDLASVDTAIEIRDQRMREMLFETGRYPSATLVGNVDTAVLNAMSAGTSANMTMEGQLMLHGTTVSVTVDMTVLRMTDTRLVVVSRKPMIVNASQVGLLDGVEKLREVAGLPSISPAVPVSFVLSFETASN